METEKTTGRPERLWSLDALRGFDMFFITGGAMLISALCVASGCGDGWLAQQMRHVPWAGFAHHDTIFPLFLFLAGVSWPFSLASQEARGRTAFQIHRKVIVRALTLFLIELSMGGLLKFSPHFRLMGVLSLIGLGWGVAALVSLHVRRLPGRLLTVALLLLGYWALLRFGIAPGAPAGADSFSKEWNLVSYFDRTVWPNHLLVVGVYEPESFFSLPGAVALALIGICAGSWLRDPVASPCRKAGVLLLSSVVLLVLDLIFIHPLGCPIVKRLWTSSFVLSAAAYSSFLLALFYWIVDVKGYRRWTFYFRVIGMNSILIYLMMRLGVLDLLGRFLSDGLATWAGGSWTAVIRALGRLAAGWGVLYLMYRKNAFLKV